MKKAVFLGGLLLAGMLALSAKPSNSGKKNKLKTTHGKAEIVAVKSAKLLQCGVGSDQITSYLQNCSHHHTTYWVQDISGTCNTNVGIENDGTATVYVSDGIITGHTDAPGMNPGP